ncbi:MAG: DNA adenine methylase [Sandaracinaceae bacterium]|nr:DNA adenine methylase [Sandaracinaceae bacterium]
MPTPAPVARIELAARPAPFIKWVGGKGRLLPQLMPLLPSGVSHMRHVEPFMGGAALFFQRYPVRALLSDVNGDLVETYKMVRDRVDEVIDALGPLADRHDPDRYYRVRERYNASRASSDGPERAAMFIYLNKTCFNGLHRVNRRGEFNVPAGRYKNPRILNDAALRSASIALRSAEIVQDGFESLVARARPGDFVYMDPPYEPVSTTASFTSYAKDGFGQDDQRRLRDVFDELTRRGCKCMLSNSDVPFIRDLYREHRIDVVNAPRAVNCNGSGRGKVAEVVVRNY